MENFETADRPADALMAVAFRAAQLYADERGRPHYVYAGGDEGWHRFVWDEEQRRRLLPMREQEGPTHLVWMALPSGAVQRLLPTLTIEEN